MTYLGPKSKKQFVVIAVGPGGYFNTDTTAPTVMAAYALYPKGQTSPAALAMQKRTISPGPGREPEALPEPSHPLPQPVAFSHKTHVQAGMQCEGCHQPVGAGEKLQIPGVAECMTCHQSVKTDSPDIQRLAQLEKNHQPLNWTRLYKLPDFVFFSHQTHLAAKVECAVCHGPVQDRDHLWQEKNVSMVGCVDCHKLRNATVTCDKCHNIGH
jgi:Zn ribbon nucleic-acid-binding protein